MSSEEDVLYSFAVEPIHDQGTLDQYLQDYPEHADQLLSLSYELSKQECTDDSLTSDNDLALIEKAWQRYIKGIDRDVWGEV
jgi:ATP-dependent protease HslVU (ClpYQ) peptidase subunit